MLTMGVWGPTVALAADTLAREMDSLDRRAELRGWEAVGRLDMRGAGTCSGALIAEDIVLTAAHCVFSDDGKPVAPKNIIFRAGLRNGDHIALSRALRVAVLDAYNPKGGVTAKQVRNDVALIKLAKPISRSLATPFALHTALMSKGELTVASYGRGRNDALSLQRTCNILAQSRGLYDFDCDITFGSSGAPVFALDGGRKRIVSVVSSMTQGRKRKTGHGMSLLDIVPQLKRKLAIGSEGVVAKPAVAKRITVGSNGGSRNVGSSKFISSK
jgi:protease YdgD